MNKKYKENDVEREFFSFSQNDVNRFMEITGDNNPIHYDSNFSKDTIFKKPIIHGFLSSCIFSKILGIKMPGFGTIYLKQELNFKKPMYVDEVYEAELVIIEIINNRYKISTKIFNDKKEITIDGYAIVIK